MPLFHLGFKQRLLLVVVITLTGISSLVALSAYSLSQQSRASKDVDRLSSSSLALAQLKVDILQTALIDSRHADQLAELNSLLTNKQALFEQLTSDGVDETDKLYKALRTWVITRKEIIKLNNQIGDRKEDGQQGQMRTQMAEMEKTMFSNMRTPFRDLAISIDAMIEQRTAESIAKYQESLKLFRTSLDKPGFFDLFINQLNKIQDTGETLTKLLLHEQTASVKAQQGLSELIELADDRILTMINKLTQARTATNITNDNIRLTLLIAGAIAAFIIASLLLLTWHTSTRALSTTVTTLEYIAEGDLRQQLSVNRHRNDEFDRLGLAVNNLTERLGALLNSVIASSHNLQSRSAELTETLQNMVKESTQVEGETSSVAAAVEEISVTAKDMAVASLDNRRLSLSVRAATDKGGAVITDALGSLEVLTRTFDQIYVQLNDLSEASARVDGVTEMINSLASQTNLLALNAAIEAARAGEAGRGFSVVADEVRALAEKTVTATGRINQIVTDMQSQLRHILQAMSEGQTQVERSRRLGDAAAGAICQMQELFTEVSDRNQQQAASVEQISATTQSIAASMSGVLDNVSRSAERSRGISSFSTQVVENTNELLEMTSRFRC
ncbi:Methyl-accepting chemotaxis protein McpB [compost metagenome]